MAKLNSAITKIKTSTKKPKSKVSSKAFHDYEIEKAKTVQDCIEIAIIDAHDEDEEASGWYSCLEDVFSDIDEVEFMGEVVEFKQFGFQGDTAIVGIIKKKGKTAKVSLESLVWIKPTHLQSLWHKAYLKYQGLH